MPSPLISPMTLLMLVVAITLLAMGTYGALRRRRRRALIGLAREWDMQYSTTDVFNLAPRVAAHLPVLGAADVRVRDLIYGTEAGGHRCIFVAEFTAGVVRSKSRRQCVVSVLEPRGPSDAMSWSSMRIAPDDRALLAQYRAMREQTQGSGQNVKT